MPTPDKQLALTLVQQRRFAEAKPILEALCRHDGGDAQSRFNLGLVHVELGETAAGIECFRAAAAIAPDRPVVHYNLGRALHMGGLLPEAEASYRRAIALSPGMAAAHCNLGNVLMDRDRCAEAIACFRSALQQDPTLSEAHYNICEAYKHLKRLDEAYAGYQRLVQENPTFAEAHGGMGAILFAQHRVEEAVQCFSEALRLNPDLVQSHYGLALCHKELGQDFKAEAGYRQALQHDPGHVPSHIGLARLLVEHGLYKEALDCFQTAERLSPEHPTAAAEAVIVLEKLGRFEEAWQRLQGVLARPLNGIGYVTTVAVAFADLCGKFGGCDEALAMVERALQRGDSEAMEDDQRTVLHFAAGRLLDAKGEYDRAFAHYARGNAIVWAMGERLPWLRFDRAAVTQAVDDTITTFTPAFMRRAPRATHGGGGRLVFIVGMPRSGSTLAEQILASHPAVYGAGELNDISWLAQLIPDIMETDRPYPRCLEDVTVAQCDRLARHYLDRIESLAPEAALLVTDKMPVNFAHLGLIELLFPGARVIHCLRDPIDTCVSCYFQGFIRSHNYQYSFDLRALGEYYREYRRLMAHWRSVLDIPMLELRYEDVVVDQEAATRRLLAFCGLPWDDGCLRYYESKRLVHTASYDQVRRPIYDKSVGRWRHYERHIGPLLKALAGGDA